MNDLRKRAVLVSLLVLASHSSEACKPSGYMTGKTPPPGQCNTENNSECCETGRNYTTYNCSAPVLKTGTNAVLTLNSFEKGGDGGAASECDDKFHYDDAPIVALSTGWFNHRKRCLKHIVIHGNGRRVTAKVVDECDSTIGCDAAHDYQPPCPHNIVDASKTVWKKLGVPEKDWGELNITWWDACVLF